MFIFLRGTFKQIMVHPFDAIPPKSQKKSFIAGWVDTERAPK